MLLLSASSRCYLGMFRDITRQDKTQAGMLGCVGRCEPSVCHNIIRCSKREVPKSPNLPLDAICRLVTDEQLDEVV